MCNVVVSQIIHYTLWIWVVSWIGLLETVPPWTFLSVPWTNVHISLGCLPRRITGLWGRCLLLLVESENSFPKLLHRSHSHLPCVRGPVVSPPPQICCFLSFELGAIFSSVQWYHVVVLFWISWWWYHLPSFLISFISQPPLPETLSSSALS